jgi:hypothetical protein
MNIFNKGYTNYTYNCYISQTVLEEADDIDRLYSIALSINTFRGNRKTPQVNSDSLLLY